MYRAWPPVASCQRQCKRQTLGQVPSHAECCVGEVFGAVQRDNLCTLPGAAGHLYRQITLQNYRTYRILQSCLSFILSGNLSLSTSWLFITTAVHFPSVLWHCWLGDKKSIRSVKGWVLVCWWRQYDWRFARLVAPVDTTTSIILCFNKHRLTQIHLEKWPLKRKEKRVSPFSALTLLVGWHEGRIHDKTPHDKTPFQQKHTTGGNNI